MRVILENEDYAAFDAKAKEQNKTTRELARQVILGWIENESKKS